MVQENVNLSTAKPPHKESHDPRIARFTASVLLLATMGLIQLIGQRLALGGPLFIAQLLFVLLCAFTNEWHLLHGEGLTRIRRPYFDVVNVLETYRTRARTMGYLFQPDPPTPMVTFLPDGTAIGGMHETPNEKTEFMQQRDAHYANMFQHAMKVNKELEMMGALDQQNYVPSSIPPDLQKPTATESVEIPSPSGTAKKPSSSESAKKPSSSESAKKPPSSESAKKPPSSESAKKPPSSESAKKPSSSESAKKVKSEKKKSSKKSSVRKSQSKKSSKSSEKKRSSARGGVVKL